jgi:PAP2 superfamily protein
VTQLESAVAAGTTQEQPTVAPVRRHRLRPKYVELLVLAVLAVAYNWVRGLDGDDQSEALRHAHDIASLEGPLFRHLELPLNHWLLTVVPLAVAACYYYAVLHYAMTPIVLLVSRARGGWRYVRGYVALVVASAIGLVCYALYPAAPPRLVPGLGTVDLLQHFSAYGWWGAAASAPRGIGDATNQFAAMPSLHFGWSLWCAIQMWGFGGKWRLAAVAYPSIQVVVVIATANHFLLDVVAGGACVLVGYAAAWAAGAVWRSRG